MDKIRIDFEKSYRHLISVVVPVSACVWIINYVGIDSVLFVDFLLYTL